MVPVVHPPLFPFPTLTPASVTSPHSRSLPDFAHAVPSAEIPISPSCSGQFLLVTHHPVQMALRLRNALIQAYTANPVGQVPFPWASRKPYLPWLKQSHCLGLYREMQSCRDGMLSIIAEPLRAGLPEHSYIAFGAQGALGIPWADSVDFEFLICLTSAFSTLSLDISVMIDYSFQIRPQQYLQSHRLFQNLATPIKRWCLYPLPWNLNGLVTVLTNRTWWK